MDNREWADAGVLLVNEVFSYFQHQMSRGATGILRLDDMNEAARLVWDDFVGGAIDEEQALLRLQIVRPARRK